MKIVFLPHLKSLAAKLEKLFQFVPGEMFVGLGLANKALKRRVAYSKTWEVGGEWQDFDYLKSVVLNEKTLEKHKLRKCPEKIVVQNYDYDCGWAAVCTLLLMLKREDVLKTDVYSRLEVNPIDGTKSRNIKKLFEEEKIPYIEIWKAELKDLESVVAGGGVALVSYQAEGTVEEIEKMECGHYSIVFDIDEESVWLIDPSYDEEYLTGYGKGVFNLSREVFEKLWIDKGIEGEVYDKWMLTVKV